MIERDVVGLLDTNPLLDGRASVVVAISMVAPLSLVRLKCCFLAYSRHLELELPAQ